jgi:glycosyltransferase involved in cell wall biosynthesis
VYYRLLGKKIVFTAHNVDSRARAGKRSVLNSTSLWLMYRIVDHVIVHTNKMKQELVSTFRVPDSKITVVPFGINICPPRTCVDSKQARNSLRVPLEKKVMLVFGSIDRYKGIEIAIESLSLLLRKDTSYYLVIAGRDKDCQDYVHELVNLIQERGVAGSVLMHNHFIPHEEVGKYFMAADCCVLSYKRIYQSGVPFLSFAFGLPVIATHVGSFREIIVDGVNGFICEPNSPDDLARKIERYFASDLLRNLPATRMAISRAAGEQYSWEKIGVATHAVYQSVAKLGK